MQYSILMPNEEWSKAKTVNQKHPAGFTNPSIISLPDGTVDIFYKSLDGTGWHRQLLPGNSLSPPKQFASNLGTSESENIAILPAAYIPEREESVIVYRQSDGFLYMILKYPNNKWFEPTRISDKQVVINAVDSEQTGADMVVHKGRVIVSFITDANRDIYFSEMNGFDQSSKANLVVSGIDGSWIRGNILYHQQSSPVYGIIYDAGSKGGSGYNKYISLDLDNEITACKNRINYL